MDQFLGAVNVNVDSSNSWTTVEPADCDEQLTEVWPTAAESHGWGEPVRTAEFADGLGPDWQVHDGPAPDGGVRRALAALTVSTGLLGIGTDATGATGGLCWTPGQQYGRWEARMKVTPTDAPVSAVALLRPAADSAEPATKIDFMNLSDPTRRSAFARVRPGQGPAPAIGEVSVDATQWHTWAVEAAATHVTAFVDGRP